MKENFIMITLNPFNFNQQITIHNPEMQFNQTAEMDTIFEKALAIGEEQGIYDIKIATVSFPKEYSEELVRNARTRVINQYGENKFNFEVL